MNRYLLIFFVFYSFLAYAQDYPEIGKPMPNFVLKNVAYFPQKTITNNDLKGKWILLDFWNESCAACVASFPRSNEIQKKYADRLQIVLVGIPKPSGLIRKLYATYRNNESLILPCAFDSLLPRQLDVPATLPYLIVIDDKGVVRAITGHVTSEDFADFFSGKEPKLYRKYRGSEEPAEENQVERYSFDSKKPLLVRNNGGADSNFKFRSLLSEFDEQKQRGYTGNGRLDQNNVKVGSFQVMAATLIDLYGYAFLGTSQNYLPGMRYYDTTSYGEYFPHLILELKDSSAFNYSIKNGKAKGFYNYSLIMPSESLTLEKMQLAMQRDLATYFGYDSKIETRDCPYLRLVSLNHSRHNIKSKTDNFTFKEIPRAGFVTTNASFKKIVVEVLKRDIPSYVVDDSGIDYPVDMELNYIPENIPSIRKALNKYGLDLVEARKPMKVLVIKD
jgi:thiol-disulfide isomerase/thioredoxin